MQATRGTSAIVSIGGLLACVAVAGGTAGSATGNSAATSRQDASVVFTERGVDRGSSLDLAFDFRDPANPGGKPPAIALIEITLQPGARFDTAAVPQCEATDAEITLQGAAACPPDTLTGRGSLITDTGAIGGLPREGVNTLTQFNGDGEAITLAESQNPPTRVVSRAAIEGNRVTIPIPPVPGGPPPDSFLAFKTFRLTGEPTRGDSPLLTTPPRCPSSGRWTNVVTFTYRDGVSETVESPSPCRPASSRVDRTAPRIAIAGVPERACLRGPFTARARARDESRVGLRLLLDGERKRSAQRKRLRKHIPVRKLTPGLHRIAVHARDAAGNRAKRVAKFRRCRPAPARH